MAVRLAIAAGILALAVFEPFQLTIPSSAATVVGPQQRPLLAARAHEPYVDSRRDRPEAKTKGTSRFFSAPALDQILGRWCDDKGQQWFFNQDVVVHDTHVHRARYRRHKMSIVVVVDGYPDVFSKFTLDGLRMTLVSSTLDPALAMRRFARCAELLSGPPVARDGAVLLQVKAVITGS